MANEPETTIPKYAILHAPGGACSVLRSRAMGSNTMVYEVLLPDVYNATYAKLIIEALVRKDDETRIAKEKQEKEFEEALKEPHAFIKQSANNPECYCGKSFEDEIHIPED